MLTNSMKKETPSSRLVLVAPMKSLTSCSTVRKTIRSAGWRYVASTVTIWWSATDRKKNTRKFVPVVEHPKRRLQISVKFVIIHVEGKAVFIIIWMWSILKMSVWRKANSGGVHFVKRCTGPALGPHSTPVLWRRSHAKKVYVKYFQRIKIYISL